MVPGSDLTELQQQTLDTVNSLVATPKQNFAMLNICASMFVTAPQVDTATSGALRYMARTKQRRTYLPYTFPA